MQDYKHILAAIDLTDEAPEVLDAARKLADMFKAELSVINVIRPLTYAYTGVETATMGQAILNFEAEAEAAARKRLEELCEAIGVDSAHRHTVFGAPGAEVRESAVKLGADLVVIGSHGRHGLGLLLGSTANSVLHGATCDVLTIRIK
ncbi:MAG: universal stress protein [Pseudomonadales bacterium]